MRSLGVLGGTFDPIHNAHLVLAEAVRGRLGLDEVLFVPAGNPWLKPESPEAPAEDRLNMVRLAVAGKPYFRVSDIEVRRPGPTYTVETIAELVKQYPGDEICFIMGWDSLAELPRWKEPQRLITLSRLAAVPRPGYPLPDIKALEKALPGLLERLTVLDEPRVDISSTVIRSRVMLGLSIHDLVPEAVERYIREHQLYLKGV